MSRNKYLLFGGGGFIGSTIAEQLVQDHEVTIVDAVPFTQTVAYQKGLTNVTYLQVNATDRSKVLELGEDYDYIVHAVAILGISKVAQESILTINTNYLSCLYALELANKQHHLKKFLTFSTSEVYGQHTIAAKESDDFTVGTPETARWCYASSKVLSEHLTYAYNREYGIPTIVIRPFNIYGEYRLGTNAITNLVMKALKNEDLIISGTGEQTRVWCHINDFVSGVIGALHSEYQGESFNLGNPNEQCSIKDLAHRIVALTQSKSKIVISGSSEPDVLQRTVDISKAQSCLGYQPVTSLEEGLKKYIAWAIKTLTLEKPGVSR
ncbi:nucleoside-diphosphate-sugar epimerase [Paenibacillus sp. RC73]|uniref:NAD-dependent epimerase/dehydratase family protein n=1 Tax=Paenibacillus sp. RC73 TaxID=3156250 RepID=UPI003838A07F